MAETIDDEIDQLQQRSGHAAVRELRAAVNHVRPCVEDLAQRFPGVVIVTGWAGGEVAGILAMAMSGQGNIYSKGAKGAQKELATVLAHLPHDGFIQTFESAFLKAKIRRAREDARELEKAFNKPQRSKNGNQNI